MSAEIENQEILDRAREALAWRPDGFVQPEATGVRWVQRTQKDFTFRGMPSWVREMYRITERNAKRRNIPFNLTRQEFRQIVERADGRCMMTGIPFEFERYEGSCRRPFAPSLDRADSSKGYSADNCRLICVLLNLAMNQWGLEPMVKVAKHLVQRQDELKAKERQQGEYRPAEYLTVKEFCNDIDVDLSRISRTRLASRASRLCEQRGIEKILVATGTRLDGSPTFAFTKGYPRTVLEEALPYA